MASALEYRQGVAPNGDGSATLSDNHGAKPAAADGATTPRALSAADETTRFGESSTPRASLFVDSDYSDAGDSEERPSTELTSPSITSPPYWTNAHGPLPGRGHGHAHGHARTFSSGSVDSVLPAGAITLQDNESEEGSQGRNFFGRDRNRGCWAKSVQVTDFVAVNGSATNIGAFVVWNIRVETLGGSHINIRKRYSEFDDFRRRLVQTFPSFEAAVPALPPKSLISKFRPHFLEKRKAGLEYFLNCILLNPEFSGSPVLKEFLFS